MSYYKVRRVSFRKDGRIFVTAADSSIRPLTYRSAEYGANLNKDERLYEFLMSVQEGNFQCLPSCKFYVIEEKMNSLFAIAKNVSSRKDFDYRIQRSHILRQLIAGFAIEGIQTGRWPDEEYMRLKIEAADRNAQKAYDEVTERLKVEGVIICSAAIRCIFSKDFVVLLSGDDCLIAKRANYDNRGWLRNNDRSAIYIAKADSKKAEAAWNFFGYGYINPKNPPQINWNDLKDIPGLDLAKLCER